MKNHHHLRIVIIITALLLVTFRIGFAINVVYEKNFEYTVDSLDKVRISNQHGNIYITLTDTDKIVLDVKLTADLDTRLDSVDFFRGVNYASSQNSQGVNLELIADPEYASNIEFDAKVEVLAPRYLLWNIINRFGDIDVDSALVVQSLTLDYGKLNASKLMHPDGKVSSISFFQSEINVRTISNAIIKCKNSILSADLLEEAVFRSEFSTLEIKQAGILDLNTETDNYSIKQADEIKLKGMYSDFSIGTVEQSLQTELNYGKFQLTEQIPGFSAINIDHQNVFTNLAFLPEASFNVNADIKYCDLVIDSDMETSLRKIEDGASKLYNGLVGNSETESSLTIIGRFENIYIEAAKK